MTRNPKSRRLRQELATLRDQYEARFAALEQKLAAQAAAAPPQVAGTSPAFTATQPPAGAAKVFNPDISAIGNFVATGGKNDAFQEPTFNLSEVETAIQAVVDPYARGLLCRRQPGRSRGRGRLRDLQRAARALPVEGG